LLFDDGDPAMPYKAIEERSLTGAKAALVIIVIALRDHPYKSDKERTHSSTVVSDKKMLIDPPFHVAGYHYSRGSGR
jgi:hypothetical protein